MLHPGTTAHLIPVLPQMSNWVSVCLYVCSFLIPLPPDTCSGLKDLDVLD